MPDSAICDRWRSRSCSIRTRPAPPTRMPGQQRKPPPDCAISAIHLPAGCRTSRRAPAMSPVRRSRQSSPIALAGWRAANNRRGARPTSFAPSLTRPTHSRRARPPAGRPSPPQCALAALCASKRRHHRLTGNFTVEPLDQRVLVQEGTNPDDIDRFCERQPAGAVHLRLHPRRGPDDCAVVCQTADTQARLALRAPRPARASPASPTMATEPT